MRLYLHDLRKIAELVGASGSPELRAAITPKLHSGQLPSTPARPTEGGLLPKMLLPPHTKKKGPV